MSVDISRMPRRAAEQRLRQRVERIVRGAEMEAREPRRTRRKSGRKPALTYAALEDIMQAVGLRAELSNGALARKHNVCETCLDRYIYKARKYGMEHMRRLLTERELEEPCPQ